MKRKESDLESAKKKLKEESEESESDYSVDSEDGEDDEDKEEIINVDFDFLDYSEIDFHGLKTLIKQIFSTDFTRDSDLSDFLISQNIGSVVKVDEGLDPYAFITVLDLNGKEEFIRELADFLKKKDDKLKMNDACLLLSCRLINMPPQLAPPLYRQLVNDVKKKYKTVYYISQVYKMVSDKEVFFYQAEDELLQDLVDYYVDYQLPNPQSTDSRRVFNDDGVETWRRIFCFKYDKLAIFQKAMDKELAE
ncbi:Mss4p nuclear export [Terramyces sp. JEL0728]|nr:Mss4p nuclear export [Terramyces sp. JEL0728]